MAYTTLSHLPHLPLKHASLSSPHSISPHLHSSHRNPKFHFLLSNNKTPLSFRTSYRFTSEDEADDENWSFDEAVKLFNSSEYYRCHDVLEHLWNNSEEPLRTLVHGVLQCAVGFHHLFNQNHRGAMMELGEGLCKLRKTNFNLEGPFHAFEQEISAVLDFIYSTQLELAACADDMCVAMDQTDRSYQLLGGYGAGQHLYRLEGDPNEVRHIVFCHERSYGDAQTPVRVKLPTLLATQQHLLDFPL